MKMRFDIEFNINGLDGYFYIERTLLMKYISYVIIDNIRYNKPIGDFKEIQNYYYFISKNKMNVSEINMLDGKHIFLKKGELHSYNTYCYNNPKYKFTCYAKNGKVMGKEEEGFFLRKRKIEYLKNKIK